MWMWEEISEYMWLVAPVFIISLGSYMIYKHPETYLDYVSVNSGDSKDGVYGGNVGGENDQDLAVFDIIDLTSDDSYDEEKDEDYTGSISSSSSGSNSSSNSNQNELYKKGFVGELPEIPVKHEVEIFEEPYVDEQGNNRTKYTFVPEE